jgi:hypothetical protein
VTFTDSISFKIFILHEDVTVIQFVAGNNFGVPQGENIKMPIIAYIPMPIHISGKTIQHFAELVTMTQ